MTTIPGGAVANLSANPYIFARFVTLTLPDYTVRLWTGIGDFVLGGQIYTGTGDLGSIAPISEKAATSNGVDSQRIQLSLSGLNTQLAQEAINYLHPGSMVEIQEAQIDPTTGAVAAASYDVFLGEVDTMPFMLGETMSITLICENYLSYLFRGNDGHYRTQADQAFLYPNGGAPDMGFQFVANLLTNIPWGQKSSVTRKVGGTSAGSSAAYAVV